MRPLRYSINVTLDGCCDHRVITPDEELHHHFAVDLERADALLFGRVTYEMMEAACRRPAAGTWPDWMADWMIPFARTIDSAKKYVVSGTLDHVDWNAELVQGDLGKAVQQLKREPGRGLSVAVLTLPLVSRVMLGFVTAVPIACALPPCPLTYASEAERQPKWAASYGSVDQSKEKKFPHKPLTWTYTLRPASGRSHFRPPIPRGACSIRRTRRSRSARAGGSRPGNRGPSAS